MACILEKIGALAATPVAWFHAPEVVPLTPNPQTLWLMVVGGAGFEVKLVAKSSHEGSRKSVGIDLRLFRSKPFAMKTSQANVLSASATAEKLTAASAKRHRRCVPDHQQCWFFPVASVLTHIHSNHVHGKVFAKHLHLWGLPHPGSSRIL